MKRACRDMLVSGLRLLVCPLFLIIFMQFLSGTAFATERSSASPISPSDYQKIAEQLSDSLDRRANPKTGLSPSYDGDASPVGRNGAQIYDTGLRLLAGSRHSMKIIRTFTADNPAVASPENPQTKALQFQPASGIFSWIRIQGFAEPDWWHTWEWSVKTGENAWLGKGALHYYRVSGEPAALALAIQRADFILALQDADGGIRIGPQGLAGDYWWRRKSTENNESALSFLDELYRVSGEKRFQLAADRLYEWLAGMYDRQNHLFSRGEVEEAGEWHKDGISNFAADTTNWLPVERILQDSRFGLDRGERLAEIERMMEATVRHAGVATGDGLAGISYSPHSQKDSVVSLEWTSQYALLCLRLSAEYRRQGDAAKADAWQRQYDDLVRRLLGYLQQVNGERVAAHAVYPDGRLAAGKPMWDDTALTPGAFLSAASHLYIGFALQGRDPLRGED